MASILFVQDVWQEYLGIMYLSAVLKKGGHKTDVLVGLSNEKIFEEIKDKNPDLIAFSTMTLQNLWVSEVAGYLREKGIKTTIIAGVPHSTFFNEFINDSNIDFLCVGEGELTLLELANAIDTNSSYDEIPNLVFKKEGKIIRNLLRPLVNLDELPFPDRDLYLKYDFFKKKDSAVFMAMRGCPYNCAFCFNHSWNNLYSSSRQVRTRSVQNMIRELKEVTSKLDLKTVMFIDSTFNLDKEWVLSFLKAYAEEISVPFSINVRANLIDEDIVKAIAETNKCASIRFAIEVGSETLRNSLLKKGLTDDQIKSASKLFKKYKLNVIAFSMFGLPTERLSDAYLTIKLNRLIKPLVVSCYVFVPFPGLDVTNYALKEGIITEEDFKKLSVSPYKMHRSVLKQNEIGAVENLHKFAIIAIRIPILLPLIKLIIRLPPNKAFDWVYNITQGLEWRKWMRISFFRFFLEALKNYKKLS